MKIPRYLMGERSNTRRCLTGGRSSVRGVGGRLMGERPQVFDGRAFVGLANEWEQDTSSIVQVHHCEQFLMIEVSL